MHLAARPLWLVAHLLGVGSSRSINLLFLSFTQEFFGFPKYIYRSFWTKRD
ncbi:hypothetical protein RAHE111665_07540 [Rariglobus hedericola]